MVCSIVRPATPMKQMSSKYIMSSTRNRNTPGDYSAQQWSNQQKREYFSYESASFYAVPVQTYFPGDGLVGMKTAHRTLSSNYSDTESFLFGIGSTNLVSLSTPATPEIHSYSSVNFLQKLPQIMPEPMIVRENQRRLFLN